MKNYQNLIKPSQIFLFFFEISSKYGSFTSYHDLLYKESLLKGDEQKNLLIKVQNLLRKMLISIDKVNTIYTLTGRENAHISEIIEIYQEKSHIYDYTELKTQKIPLPFTAKFLNNCVELLDISYKINNWKKIYETILDDYEERRLFFRSLAFENKEFLSLALENLEKNSSSLKNSFEKYTKFELIQRMNEKFFNGLTFPKCLTSQEMRMSIVEKYKKKFDKKKLAAIDHFLQNERLLLMDQDECIHKKLYDLGLHFFWLHTGKIF